MEFTKYTRVFVERELKGLGCMVVLVDFDHKLFVIHELFSKPETRTQADLHDQHALEVWIEQIRDRLSP